MPQILKLFVFIVQEFFTAGKPGIAGGGSGRNTKAFVHILTENFWHSRILPGKIIVIFKVFVILTELSVF